MSDSGGKLLAIGFSLVVILIAIAAIGGAFTSAPPRTGEEILAEIREGCQREFPTADRVTINNCVISVSLQRIGKASQREAEETQRKFDRIEREIR